MKTPNELFATLPHQFEGKNIGINVSKGWFSIFAKLCKEIDALLSENKRDFHWSQVKEKFGTGRFYWNLGRTRGPQHIDVQTPDGVLSFVNDPSRKQRDAAKAALMKSINELVRTAEEQTGHTCAVCGAPGALDRGDGYFLTLCPEHIAARKEGPKGSLGLWFAADDDFPRKER